MDEGKQVNPADEQARIAEIYQQWEQKVFHLIDVGGVFFDAAGNFNVSYGTPNNELISISVTRRPNNIIAFPKTEGPPLKRVD